MEKILQGLGVSFGKATGKVRIVKAEKDYPFFNEGQVLVTKMTNPTMVPLMGKAVAIVCEIGGMTSHPAIVAREMGLPCVVSAKEATKILQDGMEVCVNGKTGEISLIYK